jgi:hypothetical protein
MTASHPDTPAVSAPPRGKGRAAGRAGRNLVAAIGVGVGLGAVVLASLLIERHWFIPVVALAVAVCTWELAGALRRGADIRVPLPVLLVGGQGALETAPQVRLHEYAGGFQRLGLGRGHQDGHELSCAQAACVACYRKMNRDGLAAIRQARAAIGQRKFLAA